MPVDTPSHARLMGYCVGTLGEPNADGRCPVCRLDAGLTSGGYVGHHVEEPGPRSIYVDPDDSLSTVDACNTTAPGLLIARPAGSEDDLWQVFHSPTGLIIHSPRYFFPERLARLLVDQLGELGDWLGDPESIRCDTQLGTASQLMCFMAYKGIETPTE